MWQNYTQGWNWQSCCQLCTMPEGKRRKKNQRFRRTIYSGSKRTGRNQPNCMANQKTEGHMRPRKTESKYRRITEENHRTTASTSDRTKADSIPTMEVAKDSLDETTPIPNNTNTFSATTTTISLHAAFHHHNKNTKPSKEIIIKYFPTTKRKKK